MCVCVCVCVFVSFSLLYVFVSFSLWYVFVFVSRYGMCMSLSVFLAMVCVFVFCLSRYGVYVFVSLSRYGMSLSLFLLLTMVCVYVLVCLGHFLAVVCMSVFLSRYVCMSSSFSLWYVYLSLLLSLSRSGMTN